MVTWWEPSRNLGLEADLWADDPAFPSVLLQRAITLWKDDLFQAWPLVGGRDVSD